MSAAARGARLVVDLLGSEGARAVRDRALDRWADRRRRRRFGPPPGGPPPGCGVLNLSPVPPVPRRGGLAVQLLARLEHERRLRPVALLYVEGGGGDGGGLRLEVVDGDRRWARHLTASVPDDPFTARSPDLERAVAEACALAGAEAVHVESPHGLPFDSLHRIAGERALIVSAHDFGLYCPRQHLLERPALAFCHYATEPDRCRACLGQSWGVGDGEPDGRRARAAALLDAARAIVVPSAFLAGALAARFPDARPFADRLRVLPPGPPPDPRARGESAAPPVTTTGTVGGPVRRVALVGAGQPHKGSEVLLRVVAAIGPRPGLTWTVYGGGDRPTLRRFRRTPGVVVRGYHRAGTLPGRLREDGIELAVLASIVPESFGLALSECRLAGVPVVAFDHGAFAERLAPPFDVAVEPARGEDGLREALAEAIERGRPDRGEPPGPPPSARDAATGHLALYRALGLTIAAPSR